MMLSKPSRSSEPVPRNGERVRLGLTGLGAIFLVVVLVAAGLRPAPPLAEPSHEGESLAVLGVAPGAGSTAPPAPISRPTTPVR